MSGRDMQGRPFRYRLPPPPTDPPIPAGYAWPPAGYEWPEEGMPSLWDAAGGVLHHVRTSGEDRLIELNIKPCRDDLDPTRRGGHPDWPTPQWPETMRKFDRRAGMSHDIVGMVNPANWWTLRQGLLGPILGDEEPGERAVHADCRPGGHIAGFVSAVRDIDDREGGHPFIDILPFTGSLRDLLLLCDWSRGRQPEDEMLPVEPDRLEPPY